ncbi:MAG: hypothetical protein ACPGXL_04360 [Chitinophagales bacterium]
MSKSSKGSTDVSAQPIVNSLVFCQYPCYLCSLKFATMMYSILSMVNMEAISMNLAFLLKQDMWYTFGVMAFLVISSFFVGTWLQRAENDRNSN